MKALFQEAFLILVILGFLCSVLAAPGTQKKGNSSLNDSEYQYEDEEEDTIDLNDEFLDPNGVPCARDCICKKLSNIVLANCSRLQVGTQKFDSSVTGLTVENVDRKYPLILSDMMFEKLGLSQVTNIKIVNSVIASISPTAFKGLNELYSVNLSGSQIEIFDPNMFSYNPKLTLVDLSNNPLAIGKWKNSIILNSSSIQELEIASSSIKNLPKNLFSNLPNLIYINVAGNDLVDLDPSVFSKLPALEELNLSDNFLPSIPENIFSSNNEISTLRLRGNPIDSVIGVRIEELLTLDISKCNIKTVGPSMFDGMKFISNLNLSGNGIKKIHNQAFRQLSYLNYLDLSHNHLDLISDQLIKENVELDIFKVSNNPLLKSLPENGFACSSETDFNIFSFDASGCSLEVIGNNTFKTMSALSQLVLSNNKIRSLGSALKHLDRLIELDLSHNMLVTLDKNTFLMNKDLGKLNLAGNPLTTIPVDLFVNNPILTWLDVSSCQLTSLWASKFPSKSIMNNLHFVNVSNNNIKSVSVKELEIINKLFTLDISQNPLECDSTFLKLMLWLGEHNVSPAARDMMSSKMELTEKIIYKPYKWEHLAKLVCGSDGYKLPTKVNDIVSTKKPDPVKSVTEENADNNKNDHFTFDDDDQDEGNDDDDDDDRFEDGFGYNDGEDEYVEEDDYDENYVENQKNSKETDNTVESKEVVETDNTVESKEDVGTEDSKKEILLNIRNNIDTNKINVPVLDFIEESQKTQEILKDIEDEELENDIVETLVKQEHVYWQYLLPRVLGLVFSGIIVIIALIMLLNRYSAKNHSHMKCIVSSINPPLQGRVKKDCGLVYQQLSEDITGPKTPIISRQIFNSNRTNNMSYEISPFHHSKITPEHV